MIVKGLAETFLRNCKEGAKSVGLVLKFDNAPNDS